jgi:PAS domain S-box-containing protein
MSKKPNKQNSLRKKAEAQLARTPQAQARSAEDLLHELQVHQIELEMQNEELRRAQTALEESHDRYVDIYELAPVGYLMLSDTGLITEINLTGAVLLGEERKRLAKRRFARYVATEDSDRWHRLFSSLLQHNDKQSCELAMQRSDGSHFYAKLDCIRSTMADAVPSVRIILTDITQSRQAEQAIRNSEEKFRAIVDQALVGIGQSDLTGRITFANDYFSVITGYSRAELLGMRWQDLTHPDDMAQNMSFYEQVMGENQPPSFEKRYIRRDGKTCWVSISASPLRSADGQAMGVLAIVVDITKRKQTEDSLRKSSREIEGLYNKAPCGYHSLDKDGVIRRINDTELAWLGYMRDEVIGKMKWTDLITPMSRKVFLENFPAFMKRGFVHDLEFEIIRKDGTVFTGLVNATAIYDDNGDYVTSRSTVQDITKRKAAENALAKNEERARLAFSTSNLALWDYDLATGNVFLSDGWSQLLGDKQQPTFTTIEELTGLVPEEERQMVRAAILKAVKGQISSSYQVTHRVRKLDGEYIWVLSEGHVTDRDPNGQALRMIGINRDITERKKLEKEIQEHRDEMTELLNLQVAAQTTAAIAHELNQPLMAITLYSETALRLLKDRKPHLDKVRMAVEGSERQAHRAGETIRELLEFLSMKEFLPEAFDLNKEVLDVLGTARLEHELQFQSTLHLEESLPPVQANRIHVHKVLLNLLHNSIDAMQEAGVPLPSITVTVRTASDGSIAQVTLQDNGPGIRKEDIQHVFEPFFSTKPRGIGMGLAISRSLIEANGGQLWIDPQEGPGAIFHLTLPFAT